MFYGYGQRQEEPAEKRKKREWSNCRTKCKQNLLFIFTSVKGAQEMHTSDINSPKGYWFNYRTTLPKRKM